MEQNELQKLKKENRQLKKDVARLQKLLQQDLPVKEEKLEQSLQDSNEDDFEPPEDTCPKCDSQNLYKYTTPSKKVVISCKSCKKYRKVIE